MTAPTLSIFNPKILFCLFRTWSSGRSNITDGWPDPSSGGVEPENKDWETLVPEFEPGKPWKVKVITLRLI